MKQQGSLRLRLLALFAAFGAAATALAGGALWLAATGGVDALVQGAMVAGFGLIGLVAALWYFFDHHVARVVEMLAGSLRTGKPPDLSKARYLGDLGPAARDAAKARAHAAEALAEALELHAAEQAREKARLEAILADIDAGAVMIDMQERVIFYNGNAARLLPGIALDRPMDRHLNATVLRAAENRLRAGATATDLSWMTERGVHLSGRLHRLDEGRLLTLRQHASRMPDPQPTLEALRRHASTLVPILDMLDGPVSPDLMEALRAEGRGLAATMRRLSKVLGGDAPSGLAGLEELTAGLSLASPLDPMVFRAEAGPLNALLVALDVHLRAEGRNPWVTVRPDTRDGMQLLLEWTGPPVSIDRLETWLAEAPDPGQPLLSGTEILAAHRTVLWPEAEGEMARLVLPLRQAEGAGGGGGVTYDFALGGRDLASSRLADLTCVVFDLETTGLGDRDQIVQIAGLRLARGRPTGERFETLVDPGRPVPPASTAIHGITDEMLLGAPDLTSALMAFQHFCNDSVMIAHNAPFDMGFLRRAAVETDVSFPNRVLDTVLLSAMVWGQSVDHSLDALTDRLDISIPPGARHTAMGDAVATADAFLRLIPALEAKGIERFEDVLANAPRYRRLIGDVNPPYREIIDGPAGSSDPHPCPGKEQ